MKKIRLIEVAHARSGDKGNNVNIGLIARRPEDFPVLQKYVTAEAVRSYFAPLCSGAVERFELPNIGALNFVLHDALDGGGTVSLRSDAQGKTFSAALLRMQISITNN
jgi:hypothetical protein